MIVSHLGLRRAAQGRIRPECVAISKAADPSKLSEVEQLAAKLGPAMGRAILALLKKVQDAADLEAIAAALQTGDVAKVLHLIALADTGPAVQAMQEAVQAAVWGGGALAASQINARITGAHFAFDRLNPRLIEWIKGYTFSLIRQIDTETKEIIREKVSVGMTAGSNPIKVAREIKGAIGLTTKQAKAVANYRKELETFHTRRSAKGYNLGGKIDRVNNRQVFKPGEDGTPKDGIDERRLRDFRYDGKLKAAMETGKPLTPQQIDTMVAAYERKYLRYRSEVIARTEALRTTNWGVQDAWRQAIEAGKASEDLTRRMWIVSKDERLCAVCQPIPGMNPKRGVKFGQPFASPKGPVMLPPVHPNCLPAGAQVSSGCGITGATARWYQGDMVVARTASGKEISATPNHPVLTARGWVGVGDLQEGDHVVRRLGPETLTALGKDHENVPSGIEDVARSLLQSGQMAITEVPVSAEDFHGDGIGSEIAVVGAARHLMRQRDTALPQHGVQGALKRALRAGKAVLARGGNLLSMALRMPAPTGCIMCGSNLGSASFSPHSGPLDGFSLPSTSDLDAGISEGSKYGGAADAALARKIVRGSTGPVAFDEVVEINRAPFAGHVFNLETTEGHYTANGLISHNCRCSVYIRQWEPEQLAE